MKKKKFPYNHIPEELLGGGEDDLPLLLLLLDGGCVSTVPPLCGEEGEKPYLFSFEEG